MHSRFAILAGLVASSSAFFIATSSRRGGSPVCTAAMDTLDLGNPAKRDEKYGSNMAQYLVDLHDSKSVFDFCGGMMFQLVLSDKLRNHLADVASSGDEAHQPTVCDAATTRMAKMSGYSQDAHADNAMLFHGREVRQIPWAEGGMGFAIHLSHTSEDPEGWTAQEVAGYDGWGHDAGRVWRNGEMLESEGFESFRTKFGAKAYTLHHRFYLHRDARNHMWLSAEDGCEGRALGVAQGGAGGLLGKIFG